STVGYELIDAALVSDKIPQNLSLEDVGREWDDDNDVYVWKKYNNLRSLYNEVLSERKTEEVPLEFTTELLGHLDFDPTRPVHKVSVSGNKWSKESVLCDIVDLATWDEVSRMLVPDLLLHTQPCSISSPVLYKIVRS